MQVLSPIITRSNPLPTYNSFLVESHQNPETMGVMTESCKTVVTAKISNVLCVQSNPAVASPPWLQTTVFCRLQSFQPSC